MNRYLPQREDVHQCKINQIPTINEYEKHPFITDNAITESSAKIQHEETTNEYNESKSSKFLRKWIQGDYVPHCEHSLRGTDGARFTVRILTV